MPGLRAGPERGTCTWKPQSGRTKQKAAHYGYRRISPWTLRAIPGRSRTVELGGIMCRRRGTLLALAVLMLALTWTVPAAEAGPQVAANPAAQASLGEKVWGWVESWLAVIRGPLAVFEGLDCDHGSHIDPNGGSSCGLSGQGDSGDAANSDDGSHIDPDG